MSAMHELQEAEASKAAYEIELVRRIAQGTATQDDALYVAFKLNVEDYLKGDKHEMAR